MDQNSSDVTQAGNSGKKGGIFLAIGIAIGAAIGLAMDSLAVGVGMGVGVGLIIGAAGDQQARE